jgi:hypothetical protein
MRALQGLLFLSLAAAAAAIPALRTWPLCWLAPLAAHAAIVAAVPALRHSFRPWRCGRRTTSAVVTTLAVAIVSCSVLVSFDVLRHPDVTELRGRLPGPVAGSVLLAGAYFALVNAALEEVIFRGILFDVVESQWGGRVAVAATAVLFGYGHLQGYPPGPLGGVLAGLYGLALGSLRLWSDGIGLPVAAHIAADATIFAIVAG